MKDPFGDIFGDIFSKLDTDSTEEYNNFSHPYIEQNISAIYTFARELKTSTIKLKPTKKNTYVIVDLNSTILEEFNDILDAKIMFIKIVIGENIN